MLSLIYCDNGDLPSRALRDAGRKGSARVSVLSAQDVVESTGDIDVAVLSKELRGRPLPACRKTMVDRI